MQYAGEVEYMYCFLVYGTFKSIYMSPNINLFNNLNSAFIILVCSEKFNIFFFGDDSIRFENIKLNNKALIS